MIIQDAEKRLERKARSHREGPSEGGSDARAPGSLCERVQSLSCIWTVWVPICQSFSSKEMSQPVLPSLACSLGKVGYFGKGDLGLCTTMCSEAHYPSSMHTWRLPCYVLADSPSQPLAHVSSCADTQAHTLAYTRSN